MPRLCVLHFSRQASEKDSGVNNSNSQAEKSQSVLSNPATTTGIQQILLDLLTAWQNLHCQDLKTPLPNGPGRLILQIDCLSHFYDWRKLSVSTVTNHTWTTAALAKERQPNLPESAELCLLEQFTSPSSKPADLAVTKDTAHSSREGQGKKKNWREKRPWTEQVILEPSRIFSLDKL